MSRAKHKNGVLSAYFGTLQQLITLVFGLIVPRLFIQTFGSEMNGLLGSLGNLYSYLALLEAGVGTVAIQALYGPIGRDDKRSINEIMSATSNFYNKAGCLYLLGVIAISIFYPLTVTTTIDKFTIFILTILSGMGGVINFWVQGKYIVLLQAEGKKYLMSIVGIVIYISQNVIKIVMLLLGFDVIAIHVGYFIISLCQMSFYFFYMNKNYKWLNLRANPNKEALSQSNAVFVQQITWMICSNTDVLVLTYVARDLKAVSVYAIYLMIFSTVERLFNNLFGSFHYLLGQKYNTDKEGYMFLHHRYETLSMVGSFMLYTIACILTTPFMRVYTAGITDVAYVDKYLPILFTFMHLLSSSREASSRVINFAGHFKQMQWRAITESLINIVVSILLVINFGIYGVVLGTIAAYLWRTNDIIIYANKKILNRSCWNTYKIVFENLIIFIALFAVASFISIAPRNFIQLLWLAVLVGIFVCVVYYISMWLFDKETAKYVFDVGVWLLKKRVDLLKKRVELLKKRVELLEKCVGLLRRCVDLLKKRFHINGKG